MSERLDLDDYFQRIGYDGPRAATLQVLRALHLLHPKAIPFENLDPLLGKPVRLDIASLQDKLVRSRRGGYCYEHNLLFWAVLERIGFQVSGLAARVLMSGPRDAITPRSHMLLRIELDGETWLADVGFGGLTQTAPLRLAAGAEQETPHEPFRIQALDGDFLVEALAGGEWRPLYRFDLSRQHPVDYAASSYFLSASPDSHFRTGLTCARADAGRRFALRGNRLAVHSLRDSTEHRFLGSAAEIADTLDTVFHIDLPDFQAFRQRLAQAGIVET